MIRSTRVSGTRRLKAVVAATLLAGVIVSPLVPPSLVSADAQHVVIDSFVVDNPTPSPGDVVTYTLDLTCDSPDGSDCGGGAVDVTGFDFTDVYGNPGSLVPVPGSVSVSDAGACAFCDFSGPPVAVTLVFNSDFEDGEQITVEFEMTVPSFLIPPGGVLIEASAIEAISANGLAASITVTTTAPSWEIDKTGPATLLVGFETVPGELGSYEITVCPADPSTSFPLEFVVTDALPEGARFDLASDGGIYTGDHPADGVDDVVTWTFDANNYPSIDEVSGCIELTVDVRYDDLALLGNVVGARKTNTAGLAYTDATPTTSEFDTVLVGPLRLGNRLWVDIDSNGVYDVGTDVDVPDGVVVELRSAADDSLVATTTTSGGLYLFSGLGLGDYYVQVPASEFAGGGLLEGYTPAPGAEPDPNNDEDETDDHNGYEGAGGLLVDGVRTGPITLSYFDDDSALVGDEPDGDDGFDNLTLDLAFVGPASISIEKEVCDPGAACDPAAPVGTDGWVESHLFANASDVTWRITVTNTGLQALANVEVTDPLVADCDASFGDMVVGAVQQYTCESLALTESIDPNTASVTGEPAVGDPLDESDTASAVVADDFPSVSIVKRVNGADANTAPGLVVAPGTDLEFTYEVTNTGDEALAAILVTDDQGVVVTCPEDELEPLESMVCTGGPVPAPVGQYTNVGSVTATSDPSDDEVSDDDPANAFGATPSVEIEKSVQTLFEADDPIGPYVLPGATVKWTYRVTNTGNTSLADVAVVDDQIGPVVCPQSTLAPAESMTCTVVGVAASGQYTNTGSVTGTPVDGGGDPLGLPPAAASDDANYFGATPAITVEKSVNTLPADAAPGPFVVAGSTVTFDFELTNTGNVPLTNVLLTDNLLGEIECPDTFLAVGGSMTCTRTAPAVAGAHLNTATVTARGPNLFDENGVSVPGQEVANDDPAHYFGSAPDVSIVKRVQTTFDADVPTGPSVAVGENVKWTYFVTNTGNVTLSGLAVTDDVLGAITCPETTLLPGGSMTCTETGSALAGQYTNLGTVVGNGPDTIDQAGDTVPGAEVTASNPANYWGALSALDIQKYVQTYDADDATVPPALDVASGGAVPVQSGSLVKYTYVVVNVGNTTLTNVRVLDDLVANDSLIACDAVGNNVIGTLAPGDSSTCEYFTTALLSDGDPSTAETRTNNGSVSGRGPATIDEDGLTVAGVLATDVDPATYLVGEPAIEIVKYSQSTFDSNLTAPDPYVATGDDLLWVFEVTNTGNLRLTGVEVTDDPALTISCPADVLDVGESMTCTAEGIAEAGLQKNTASVVGTPDPVYDQDGGEVQLPDVTDSDDAHYFGSSPAIELVKYTQTLDSDTATGPLVLNATSVRWTYKVTNTGNVPLTDVTVVDDQIADDSTIDCDGDNVIATMAVDEVVTCTLFGTAEPGQYANTGSVSGTAPDTWGPLGQGDDGVTGGDDDDLVPGEVVTDDNPDHYYGVVNQIGVVKTVQTTFDANDPTGPLVAVGATVLWTYTVTNLGNEVLTDIAVVDDQIGDITCPETELPAGESMTCTATSSAVAGQYTNVADVEGTGPDTVDQDGGTVPGEVVSDSDSANYFGSDPSIDVEKLVDGFDADDAPGLVVLPGQSLEFTYEVTNTGNVPLTDVGVEDDQLGTITCPESTLDVGESMTCTAAGVAGPNGLYTNVGTATGQGPTTYDELGEEVPGLVVTDEDSANVFAVVPGIDVTKYVVINGVAHDANTLLDAPSVGEGQTFTWQVVVTNTGNVPLVNVVVVDLLVPVTCPGGGQVIPILAVGASVACEYTGSVATLGATTNTASATGVPNPPLLPGQPPVELAHYLDADPAVVIVTPRSIPATGSSPIELLRVAAILLLGGLALCLAGNRRRRVTEL